MLTLGPFWRSMVLYGSGIASMLAGGSFVHSILKPDLTVPVADADAEDKLN
jgi:hypothetical protein